MSGPLGVPIVESALITSNEQVTAWDPDLIGHIMMIPYNALITDAASNPEPISHVFQHPKILQPVNSTPYLL